MNGIVKYEFQFRLTEFAFLTSPVGATPDGLLLFQFRLTEFAFLTWRSHRRESSPATSFNSVLRNLLF